MNDHSFLKTLKPGDVLNITQLDPAKDRDVFFVTVLREDRDKNGNAILFLSHPSDAKPVAIPTPFNPYQWDNEKHTLVDREGDPITVGVTISVEREAGLDVVAEYERIPRTDRVQVHVSEEDFRTFMDDPAYTMAERIIQNGDVTAATDAISLVLDQLEIPHDMRQLSVLTGAILHFAEVRTRPNIPMGIIAIPVHLDRSPEHSDDPSPLVRH